MQFLKFFAFFVIGAKLPLVRNPTFAINAIIYELKFCAWLIGSFLCFYVSIFETVQTIKVFFQLQFLRKFHKVKSLCI